MPFLTDLRQFPNNSRFFSQSNRLAKASQTPQLIGDLSCEKTDKKFLFDQMIFDKQEN